jgi:hypothetical protein
MLIARDRQGQRAAAAQTDKVCRAPWTEELAVPAGCRLVADAECNWTVDCSDHPAPAPQWRQAS